MFKRLLLSAALLGASLAFAGGYQLYSESATDVLATAGAVVGRKGMSSSPWYNPAAASYITRPTLSFGGTLIKLSIHYHSPYGGGSDLDAQWRYTGFLYNVIPINDRVHFSLSMNAPYGMITHWKSGWQEDTLATYTSIRCMYTTPNISFKVRDDLAVAAGFNFVYGTARVGRMIQGNAAAGVPRNKMYLRADGHGFGYTVSAHYQPFEHWGFGAHYQSRVKIKFEGSSDFRYEGKYAGGLVSYQNDDVGTTLTMPATFAIGVANTSIDKLTLCADALWT